MKIRGLVTLSNIKMNETATIELNQNKHGPNIKTSYALEKTFRGNLGGNHALAGFLLKYTKIK